MAEFYAVPAPAQKSRLDALTIVRFFAALWVLAFHFDQRVPLPLPTLALRLAKNGAYAMTLFFVLSGVVLAYGYHRMRPRADDVVRFYQARLARIYPAYAVLHVLALFWALPVPQQGWSPVIYTNILSALGIQAWFPHVAMAGANAGTWSVSAEFFFYALFPALLPALAYLRKRWGTFRVAAGIALLSGFFGFADNFFIGTLVYYYLPIMRLPEFMLGVVIGLELVEPAAPSARRNLLVLLAGVAALGTALNPSLDYGLWIRANCIVVPTFAWFIFELARWEQRRATAAGFLRRLLVYLGESSYCLFLTHILALLWIDSPVGKAWKASVADEARPSIWVAGLVVSLVGAIALHELVEKPARRALLKRWRPAEQPA